MNQENGHKAEELSRVSSDLQNLLTATEIATLLLDRHLRILRFTPRAVELFNLRVTDRGLPIEDLTHRLRDEDLRGDAEAVLTNTTPIEREVQDERGRWYLLRVLPYRSTEDRVDGIVMTLMDITSQKKAESSIRNSARELFVEGAWLRTILDSLSNGIVATDGAARVRYVNPVAARWMGWQQSEAMGKLHTEVCELSLLSGEALERHPIAKALEEKTPTAKERFRLRSRTGGTLPVEGAAAPILIDGEVEGAVAVMTDISDQIAQEELGEAERDRLEEEISRSTNELGQTRADLRALSGYLMIAQEQERRRIARELHDDFGQRIALLSFSVDRALERVNVDPEESEKLLRSIREELGAASQGLREVSYRLHPAVIEDLGLIPALKSLSRSFNENGSEVRLTLAEEIPDLALDTSTALYRIAQEGLRNAQNHAKGAPIELTLRVDEGLLLLKIQDEGPGFELARARAKSGLGLLSMQERARLVNGTLTINSQPGQGTTVSVSVRL